MQVLFTPRSNITLQPTVKKLRFLPSAELARWAASKQPRIASACRIGLHVNVGFPWVLCQGRFVVFFRRLVLNIKHRTAGGAAVKPFVTAGHVVAFVVQVSGFASAVRACHFSPLRASAAQHFSQRGPSRLRRSARYCQR